MPIYNRLGPHSCRKGSIIPIALALLVLPGGRALADFGAGACVGQDPIPQPRPPKFLSEILERLPRQFDPDYVRWVDANFLFEAKSKKDSIQLKSVPNGQSSLSDGRMLGQTYFLFVQGTRSDSAAPSLHEYLNMLKTNGRSLPRSKDCCCSPSGAKSSMRAMTTICPRAGWN